MRQIMMFAVLMGLLVSFPMKAIAQQGHGTPIPLTWIDDSGVLEKPHKSPILVPVLYLDGYTLTASDNTVGATIQLLDEDDNVVFSTYVYIEGDIALPTTLEGTYTIQVIRGDETFEGEIEL